MNLSEATQSYRQEDRMRLIQEQRQSGLTVKVWCERNNISENSYYYWLREIKKSALSIRKDTKQTEAHSLVKIDLPERIDPVVGITSKSGIRLQYKGAMMEIPPRSCIEDVTIVLKALNSI